MVASGQGFPIKIVWWEPYHLWFQPEAFITPARWSRVRPKGRPERFRFVSGRKDKTAHWFHTGIGRCRRGDAEDARSQNVGKIVLDPSLEPKPKPATPAKGKNKDDKKKQSSEDKKDADEQKEEEKDKKDEKKEELTNGDSGDSGK